MELTSGFKSPPKCPGGVLELNSRDSRARKKILIIKTKSSDHFSPPVKISECLSERQKSYESLKIFKVSH